jgi:large subunit ribosomal protein L22
MATRIREKAKKREESKDKRPRAIAKNIRISPFKVRAVLDVIRGKSYTESVALLSALNKSSSLPILKAVNSAAANAENNLGFNKDELFVAECYADQGAVLKRMMAKAKGRGTRVLKRTSHITVVMDVRSNNA